MATETLRPSANGDVIELTPSSGSNYQCVDEEAADDDSTYVKRYAYEAAFDKRDLYGLPDHSGSGTINYVKIYIRCKKAYSPATYAFTRIKTNGTEYDGSQNTLATSYVNYSQQYNTNPYTGSAWTWTEIDNLQAGVRLKGDDPGTYGQVEGRCTQVYVEIDYTAVTEKTSSDTGSGADVYVSLEKTEAKSSSDTGSGTEGTPTHSAILSGSETGSGIEAFIARLLAAFDAGTGIEVGSLLKELFASELGRGSDSLAAKIEIPTKGGGMKLWT